MVSDGNGIKTEQIDLPPKNEVNGAPSTEGVTLIHLSDIHVGMTSQGWMWPTLKKAFLEDLQRMVGKIGGVDLVIFSGDLTQKGTEEEFGKLTEILEETWAVMMEGGRAPLLFPVPGNHDLVRPDASAAATKALIRWWQDEDLRTQFWHTQSNEYRELVQNAFSNYKTWLASLSKANISTPPFQFGILAGDAAASCAVRSKRIGLIGLNSAWLHLADGDYKGQLAIDTRQLHAVTADAPDDWCAANDFNLLVTHHPASWLHPVNQSSWRSEVFLPSRFDCHIFGHMHYPASTSIAEGGGSSRRQIQGASLFGLEHVRGATIRTHGYSAIQLYGGSTQRSVRGGRGFSDGGVSGFLPVQYSNRRAEIHEETKT
jgi:predicted MPP superfamily phosphohydrolase